MDKIVLKRIPPGDRWIDVKYIEDNEIMTDKNEYILSSLTEGLNYIFHEHDIKEFKVNAEKGEVSIDDGIEPKKEVKEYELYQ